AARYQAGNAANTMRLRGGGLMHSETTHRGRLLCVARAFLGLDLPPAAQPPGLRALHVWLDTWHGIGMIAHGLARQDRDLSLMCYRARWGATVFVTGMEHSIGQSWTPLPIRGRPTPTTTRRSGTRSSGSISRRAASVPASRSAGRARTTARAGRSISARASSSTTEIPSPATT